MGDGELSRRRDRLQNELGGWHPMGLAARFDSIAARCPDRPYVITDAAGYTYRDLQQWSRDLAGGLYNRGVRPGDRVAFVIDNRPELIAVKLAIARLGATAVPVNFQYRAAELTAILARSEASVLISIDASIGVDHLAVLDAAVPGWESRRQLPQFPQLPQLHEVLLVSSAKRPGAPDLAGLVRQAKGAPVRRLEDQVDPDSACDIVFTSGTSGHPLGAVLTHDMITRSAYGSAYHRGFEDAWRICFSLPMYHVFGYVEGMLAAMFAGGAVVPHAVFNPRSILSAIQAHRVNEVLFVPTMSAAVVQEAARNRYDLSSLESVFSAAAPAPVWLWQRLEEELAPRQLLTGYGQTEVSAATTSTAPGDPIELVAGTVGRDKLGGSAAPEEMDGVLARYRTIDPFTGAVLAPGAEGELSVRGPIVTRGYFNDPDRSTALIDPDGWLRTGDLGRIRPDGYLELTGRSSELFKVGGELVAPKQVEEVLTGYSGVAQAYVAGVPDDRLGEVGWAWVVPDEDATLTEAQLIRHCHGALAGFKVPRRVVFLTAEELPKTTTGKVQKFQLVRAFR